MKNWLMLLGALIVGATIAVGIGAAVLRPWENSDAAFSEYEVKSLAETQLASHLPSRYTNVTCFDAEYKPQRRAWILECKYTGPSEPSEFVTVTFDDETGEIIR